MQTVAITGATTHFAMSHLITEELVLVVTGRVGTVISITITTAITVMHLIELEVVHSSGRITIVHRHEVQEMKVTPSITRQPSMLHQNTILQMPGLERGSKL
jgi:intracellular septation protein A